MVKWQVLTRKIDCCLACRGDHHGYGRSGTARKLWEVPVHSQVSIALPIYANSLSVSSHKLGTYPTCIHSLTQDIYCTEEATARATATRASPYP
jgi:hypothetical protein